jgi:hypothetical protein
MRYDRVVRKGYEDDKLVYSLALDDHGLYIVHTGNTGGLINDQGEVNVSSDDASTPEFVRQLVMQEKRLADEPLQVLVHEIHSAFVPLQQVTHVQADTDTGTPTLIFDTADDHYHFVFTHDTEEQFNELVDALKSHSLS